MSFLCLHEVCSNDWAAVTGDTKSSNISGTRHSDINSKNKPMTITAGTRHSDNSSRNKTQ